MFSRIDGCDYSLPWDRQSDIQASKKNSLEFLFNELPQATQWLARECRKTRNHRWGNQLLIEASSVDFTESLQKNVCVIEKSEKAYPLEHAEEEIVRM